MVNIEIHREIAHSLLESFAATPCLCSRGIQVSLHAEAPVVCLDGARCQAFVQVQLDRDQTHPNGVVHYAVFTLEKAAQKPVRVLRFTGAEFHALYGYVTSMLAA